jgi:chemotaxis protein CheX
MPAELTVELMPHDVAQIVESVFENMLGLEVVECGEPWFQGSDRMTAAVHLTGIWNGAFELECSRSQACFFAGRFLSKNPPAVVDDVVRDVLGELANMIGGNLKCVLPKGLRLTMPAVVDGSDRVQVCGAEVQASLCFQCSEGLFWVTILTSRS